MGAPTTYKGKQFGRDLGRVFSSWGYQATAAKLKSGAGWQAFGVNIWGGWGCWLVCLPRWLGLLLVGRLLI